jgi:hypothetical protein
MGWIGFPVRTLERTNTDVLEMCTIVTFNVLFLQLSVRSIQSYWCVLF